jgi:hypothetical protein
LIQRWLSIVAPNIPPARADSPTILPLVRKPMRIYHRNARAFFVS